MNGHSNGYSETLGQLATPTRNNFFYGKLMTELHFQMEQNYFKRMRRLVNRHGLGTGVLCGLEVTVAEDGHMVVVQPGVAVDEVGRLIVVPEPYCVENPRQPTDGDPIVGEGEVTLCLAYHECKAEPVPVLVGDCETRQDCMPSTVRERYRLLLRQGLPDPPPPFPCEAIFPDEPPEDFDRRVVACETLSGPCQAPDDDCVVLAVIRLPAVASDSVIVDMCRFRRVLYSNAMLLELLLCLAARVDACCRVRLLNYVSGDAQEGDPGAELADPLGVQVVNGAGDPVEGETVTFSVRGGGGTVDPVTVDTGNDGRAEARLTLGPGPGPNTVEARIGSGSHVIFHAHSRVRLLNYVSGDAQQGVPGTELATPLVVEVVDGGGTPVEGETVTFSVRGGGGTVDPVTVDTGNDGRATAVLTLGPNPGLNIVEARLASGAHVVFHALSVIVDGDVPEIVAIDASPNPAISGQSIGFRASVTGDEPITYLWNFGDETSTLARPRHRFIGTRTVDVTLRVSNAFGADTGGVRVVVSAEDPVFPDVLFGQNSDALTLAEREVLTQNVAILRERSNLCINVEGSALRNERGGVGLARLRAEVVAEFYQTNGIRSRRMMTSAVRRQSGAESRRVATIQIPCEDLA